MALEVYILIHFTLFLFQFLQALTALLATIDMYLEVHCQNYLSAVSLELD